MHVRNAVLAGKLDRVDVLVHKRVVKDIGLCVGIGPGGHAAGEGCTKGERRHPVLKKNGSWVIKTKVKAQKAREMRE